GAVIETSKAATSLRADDALRHGEVQAEGIADREDPITDARRLVIAEGDRREIPAVDLDDGNVSRGITADDLGVELTAIGENHRHLVRIGDDVIVGEDQAVR